MYNASIDAWADPVTGAIVKGRKHVRQWAEDNGELLMPLADLTLTYNPQTIAKLTTDAKDAGKQLELVSKTLPIVLPIVGLIFAGLGVLLLRPEKGAEPKAVPPADSKDAKKHEDSAAVEESVAAEPANAGEPAEAEKPAEAEPAEAESAEAEEPAAGEESGESEDGGDSADEETEVTPVTASSGKAESASDESAKSS